MMFGSGVLKNGTHTLVMEAMEEDSETFIDYLEVTSNAFSPTATRTSSSSLPTGVLTSTQSTLFSSTLFSSSTPAPTSDARDGFLSPGAAAGVAVVATLGLLLILLLAGRGLRRWRKSKERSEDTKAAHWLNQMNCISGPRLGDTRSRARIQPFLLFASTVENSRKNAEQPPSAGGGASPPIRDRDPDHQPSILGLDDSPPSYTSQ
ncbi:hypothetical protein PQX77_011482 [Marasmius sp. AFHP31]|nr:hypothetical protein PQX77_011482 [Marasmius sp. AFHP31]